MLDGLGHIALAQGRWVEAHALFTEKEQLARDSDDLSSRAYALFGLGEVNCESAEPVLALRAHEEALALREKLGEKGNAAESGLAIAQLHLLAGRLPEAARLADAALDEFNAEGRRLDEARASAVRIRTHLAAVEIEPARALLARAQAAVADCQDLEAAIQVGLAAALVELRSGDPRLALQLAFESERRAVACGHERLARQVRRIREDIQLHDASSAASPPD